MMLIELVFKAFKQYAIDYSKIVSIFVKVIIGIVGGISLISALYLKHDQEGKEYKIKRSRIFILMFFAVIGSTVFAPMIVDYFSLKGSFETFTGFACAMLSNVIIEILLLAGEAVKKQIPDIITNKLDKWFKNK